MSRPKSLFGRIQQYETHLIEDLFMSGLIFAIISMVWARAPAAWPQIIYYFALVVCLFGYFKYVSPPPTEPAVDS
ncbi:hypothetical protein halTADL_0544 [Halohasta litchfieldiae]|jgi:uncharacterized membrane protein|uniref:DUF8119 domain-containing protein n=1 Tax=Halohasta litchfieldiae TaxID=1073996 RepID=A0A1H6XQB5_9EURY|nr:hypothetical protein [Halohasta litchfieldiae]ATW87348.1 hypothetical protein halTADL_0544 [Halohasta litchfieldiae]SEJ31263.1 hypothetical protein SAMN05444271_1452 [Halohasta litchfieldiae]